MITLEFHFMDDKLGTMICPFESEEIAMKVLDKISRVDGNFHPFQYGKDSTQIGMVNRALLTSVNTRKE